MQASTHLCEGGEEWLICGWVNGDVIWQTFGVACLLGLWRWKCRKLVKNSKSWPRAWDLVWYYMDDDAFLRRSFLIFLQFSSASNSSCLQPWNSNSWWTPADCRVESETGLLTSEALQKCTSNILWKPSITECFLLFWSELLITFDMRLTWHSRVLKLHTTPLES